MGTPLLGIILIVIGVIALGAGIAGGITTMFVNLRKEIEESRHFGGIDLPTELIKALTDFLKALTEAPQWLALCILGILLIGWGGTML